MFKYIYLPFVLRTPFSVGKKYLRRAKISVENSETRKRYDTCDVLTDRYWMQTGSPCILVSCCCFHSASLIVCFRYFRRSVLCFNCFRNVCRVLGLKSPWHHWLTASFSIFATYMYILMSNCCFRSASNTQVNCVGVLKIFVFFRCTYTTWADLLEVLALIPY